MVRFRRSTGEWCMDLLTFKMADPGRIWQHLTGAAYTPPSQRGVRKGMIR